jgi:hypothetical protein
MLHGRRAFGKERKEPRLKNWPWFQRRRLGIWAPNFSGRRRRLTIFVYGVHLGGLGVRLEGLGVWASPRCIWWPP